jgi:hypothetical protein
MLRLKTEEKKIVICPGRMFVPIEMNLEDGLN